MQSCKMAKSIVVVIFILFACNSIINSLLLDSSLLDALDDTAVALERERATEDFTAEVVPIVPKRKTLPVRPGITLPIRPMSEVLPVLRRKSSGGKKGGGHKWSSSRRRVSVSRKRPISVSRRRTVSPKKRPRKKSSRKTGVKKSRVPLNKNLQASNQIQNGMLEAAAMRHGLSRANLLKVIKQACEYGEYIFARQMLGHNIYNSLKGSSAKRGRRATKSASQILNDVKSQIGNDNYKHLLAYDGLVTLAFAFDSTGSMGDEMKNAKELAKGIVLYDRQGPVDYALFPFNDPVTHALHGPAEFRLYDERDSFLDLLSNLRADGGGDCKEMTIHGIQGLFNAPIQMQSPIYVFTDAGAKDATQENIEALKILVSMYQTPLNFFLSHSGCIKKEDIKFFETLAETTGGHILYFSSSSTIASMTNFVRNTLIGSSSIPVIPIGRQKRSVRSRDYSILVDNSVDTLSATVTVDTSNNNVRLYNPDGTLQSGKNTGKSKLFLVNKPTTGVWKLSVPVSSGSNFITAKCVSFENIDFDYYFLVEAKILRNTKTLTTKYPIKGKTATVVITIPAYRKTQPSSLKLKVVNKVFQPSSTVSLRQYGRTPGRYIGTFPSPSYEFKMVLEGKTKENSPFQRLGNGLINPSSVFIHVFSAPKGFVLTSGSSSTTILMFALHNSGARDIFEVKVKEFEKSVVRVPRGVYGIPGRMSLFTLPFRAPSVAKSGQKHNIVVTVVGKNTGAKCGKGLQLFIQ